jgi:hypothetical protein
MSVPGVAPLIVGCPHIEMSGRRFSWSGSVLIVKDPLTYILSAADWLTLVEKFGLAANVKDAARKG